MFILEELLKDLDSNYRKIIIIFILFIFSAIPFSLGFIAININSFQFKNETTEINLKGKNKLSKLANDTEYSTNQSRGKLENLDNKFERLKKERPRDPLVNEVVQEFNEFKPTVTEQLENAQETTNLLEAISQ